MRMKKRKKYYGSEKRKAEKKYKMFDHSIFAIY